jgi:hypothetical protein
LNEGLLLPVFQYFLVVGSVLTGLIFYANSVMAPVPLPFSVSQRIGLPESGNAPVVIDEASTPVIIATTVESTTEVKKPVKAVRKHKSVQIVRQPVPQGRFAEYPPRETGGIW